MLYYDYECKYIVIDTAQTSISFLIKWKYQRKWRSIYLIPLIVYLKIKYLIKK